MRQAGFVDVEEKSFFAPTGSWPEDPLNARVGNWQLLNIMNGLEGFTVRNLANIGWGKERCDKLMADVKEELARGDLRSYNDFLVVIGRKPL